jgi:hypothetical protein
VLRGNPLVDNFLHGTDAEVVGRTGRLVSKDAGGDAVDLDRQMENARQLLAEAQQVVIFVATIVAIVVIITIVTIVVVVVVVIFVAAIVTIIATIVITIATIVTIVVVVTTIAIVVVVVIFATTITE